MPVSKKRKKKRSKQDDSYERGADRLSGVTLQDLINVVAYQENEKKESQDGQ